MIFILSSTYKTEQVVGYQDSTSFRVDGGHEEQYTRLAPTHLGYQQEESTIVCATKTLTIVKYSEQCGNGRRWEPCPSSWGAPPARGRFGTESEPSCLGKALAVRNNPLVNKRRRTNQKHMFSTRNVQPHYKPLLEQQPTAPSIEVVLLHLTNIALMSFDLRRDQFQPYGLFNFLLECRIPNRTV